MLNLFLAAVLCNCLCGTIFVFIEYFIVSVLKVKLIFTCSKCDQTRSNWNGTHVYDLLRTLFQISNPNWNQWRIWINNPSNNFAENPRKFTGIFPGNSRCIPKNFSWTSEESVTGNNSREIPRKFFKESDHIWRISGNSSLLLLGKGLKTNK